MNRSSTSRWRCASAAWALTAALLAGCGGGGAGDDAAVAPTDDGDEASRPAGTLAVPGGEPSMPPGHPEVAGALGLAWSVPAGWTEQAPASSMRVAQYAVDGPGGTAECVVYYFGPNQGGSPMANAERWAGQFTQPDGGSSLERMKVEALESAQVPVQIVEVAGTYDGGMTMTAEPPQAMEGYMLLGGIAQGPDAPWFFKFTGPEQTVRAQRAAFLELMNSIRTADRP